MKTLVALLVLGLWCQTAFAGLPGDGLMDETMNNDAITEVGRMSKEELSVLAVPLSACASLDAFEGGLPRYFCNKELLLFRAGGTRHRAVEALISHYYLASRTISMRGREGMIPQHKYLLTKYLTVLDPLIMASAERSRELGQQTPRK